jgi:3-hydroxyisobutyrate dehydrogenase-like beta-hydroxyacid dehydrogenase
MENINMSQADIAVVGLAVMGENLILNMESKGFTVACFNRTVSKVDDFMKGRAKGKNIIGCHSVEEMVANLKTPRKVMVMVKAGKPVDMFIDQVLPHLEDGDIRRCPSRPLDHARRLAEGMGCCKANFPKDLCTDRYRRTLLRLGWRKWRWSFC